MDELKEKAIQQIVETSMKSFADALYSRHVAEKDVATGTINQKRNNVFIRELGDEFTFYSALVRSFDSSLGNILENIGNGIAALSYQTQGEIDSYILPAQLSKIQELIDAYSTDANHRVKPLIAHYNDYDCIKPHDITSFKRRHVTDHCFYDEEKDMYYLIELKAGGDLDNKKAPAEKKELLTEYFMLRNKIGNKNIRLFFATAYNKYGEGNPWTQGAVRNCFDEEELLIGKDYWDFVCNDPNGFKIVIEQYRKSAVHIQNALTRIKEAYI